MEIVTEVERPDLLAECRSAFAGNWPEFTLHGDVAAEFLDRAQLYFPRLDILLLDAGQVVAGGWGVAMAWDGTVEDLPDGYDGALVRAIEGHEATLAADTLCLMAIVVAAEAQRKGLAGAVISALRQRGDEQRLTKVVAPVRPTLKSRYPLTTMDRFASWRRDDGQHVDPWIRTHLRMGATILGTAPRSQTVTGSCAEWEEWTDIKFPDSGPYVVPGALNLLHVDRDADRGVYEEDNLWLQHLGPDVANIDAGTAS
jgi:GNAT superfamily N-acetyltransferase